MPGLLIPGFSVLVFPPKLEAEAKVPLLVNPGLLKPPEFVGFGNPVLFGAGKAEVLPNCGGGLLKVLAEGNPAFPKPLELSGGGVMDIPVKEFVAKPVEVPGPGKEEVGGGIIVFGKPPPPKPGLPELPELNPGVAPGKVGLGLGRAGVLPQPGFGGPLAKGPAPCEKLGAVLPKGLGWAENVGL